MSLFSKNGYNPIRKEYYLYCDSKRKLTGLRVCFNDEDSSLSEDERRELELDLEVDIGFEIADVRRLGLKKKLIIFE